MKIHCIEQAKEDFDKIPFKEVRQMVGWIEPPTDENPMWDVVMADGCGFECNNQSTARILASIEEVKAMLMLKEARND